MVRVRGNKNSGRARVINKSHIQCPAYNLIAQWVLDTWNNIDPILICKSFKYYSISNSQNRKEDHLIFDYDQLGPQTNSHNYIYIQEGLNDISEGSNINTEGGSSDNMEGSFSDNMEEGSSNNTNKSLNVGTSEHLNNNPVEEINLISDDNSQVSENESGNSRESKVNHVNDDEYTSNNSEDDDNYASENGSHYISNNDKTNTELT
ncbi:29193_t:CDS:2 [Gigaspora margarita]|uniref:29193_t:CDS:1 n=1 Tax=Gigaspora margarita TaxID=4874 RepID=A0ABN7VRM4_GIGMA|nr:29193_t:CDS:2 [Gigaspora margarita]